MDGPIWVILSQYFDTLFEIFNKESFTIFVFSHKTMILYMLQTDDYLRFSQYSPEKLSVQEQIAFPFFN